MGGAHTQSGGVLGENPGDEHVDEHSLLCSSGTDICSSDTDKSGLGAVCRATAIAVSMPLPVAATFMVCLAVFEAEFGEFFLFLGCRFFG